MNWNEILYYEDGDLYWKRRSDRQPRWNNRYAGTKAGCSWSSLTATYWVFRVNKKRHYAHRVIWEMHNGPIPNNMQIDHIDGDGLNNSIENLRLASATENSKNRKVPSDNQSGVMGVFQVDSGNWEARIGVNRKVKCLGTFTDKNEAIAARKAAEVKYGFHRNHGR